MFKNDPLSKVSFWIFSILSFLISLNMYIQLGSNIIEKIFFCFVTTGLEIWKISAVLKAGDYWFLKERFKAIKKYIVYYVLAFLSIFAGYGYSLTATEHKATQDSSISSSVNEEIDSLKNTIKRHETSISSNFKIIEANIISIDKNNIEISKLPETGYNNTKLSFKNQNDKLAKDNENLRISNEDLSDKIEELNSKINTLNEEKKSTVAVIANTRNMYSIIADATPFKETGNDVRYFTLIIMAIMIEIGIFSNSTTFHKEEVPVIIEEEKPIIPKKKKRSKRKPKLVENLVVENPVENKEPEVITPTIIEEPALVEEVITKEPVIEKLVEVKPVEVILIEKPIEKVAEVKPIEKPIEVKPVKKEIKKVDSSKTEFEIRVKKDKILFKKIVSLMFYYLEEAGGKFFINKNDFSLKTGISMEKINHSYDELRDMKLITYDEGSNVWIPSYNKEYTLAKIEENYL